MKSSITKDTPQKKVAYILKMFPRFSETFILNELLELERQGVPLHLFSLKNPNESFRQGNSAHVTSPVTYIPEPIKVTPIMLFLHFRSMWPIVKANYCVYRKNSKRYLETFRNALHFKSRKVLKHFFAAGYIANILLKDHVDHIHANFAHDPATVGRFVHLLTGIPFSFTAHAKDIYLSPESVLRENIQTAKFVVTCTDSNRRYLSNLSLNANPIYTIRHGLNVNIFSRVNERSISDKKKQKPSQRRPLILSVGRLVEKKGFGCLIEACGLLKQWGVNFACHIVGEGPLKLQLERSIHNLDVQDHVQIIKFLPQEDLACKYSEAKVFALSCQICSNGDRDGIPNVLVEAMAMGLPVVTTPVSGIPELVEPSKTGIFVPPENPLALAQALKAILLRPFAYDELVWKAKQKVENDFNLSGNVKQLIGCFEQV